VARGRMYGNTRLLIYHKQALVLVEYIDMNIRSLELCFFWWGNDDLYNISGFQLVMRFAPAAVDQYQFFFLQVLLNVRP
jgi:hypothetical protein